MSGTITTTVGNGELLSDLGFSVKTGLCEHLPDLRIFSWLIIIFVYFCGAFHAGHFGGYPIFLDRTR